MNAPRLSALLLGAALGTAACQSNTAPTETAAAGAPATSLTPGPWRGELTAQGQSIPFLFEVKEEAGRPVVYLINQGLSGEERLRCAEITTAGDSTTIRLGKFDAALVLRAAGPDMLKGAWVKYDSKTPSQVPLTATRGAQPLFPATKRDSRGEFGGNWRATFVGKGGRSYPATGVFTQKDSALTGTFRSASSDYRLSGNVDGQELRLSRFDGNQALLFTARNGPPEPIDITKEYAPNTLFGYFYSGTSDHETWTAVPDPTAQLLNNGVPTPKH